MMHKAQSGSHARPADRHRQMADSRSTPLGPSCLQHCNIVGGLKRSASCKDCCWGGGWGGGGHMRPLSIQNTETGTETETASQTDRQTASMCILFLFETVVCNCCNYCLQLLLRLNNMETHPRNPFSALFKTIRN